MARSSHVVLALALMACSTGPAAVDAGRDVGTDVGHDAFRAPNDAYFGDTNAADSGACATQPTLADIEPILRSTAAGGCASSGCHCCENPGEAGALLFDLPDIRSQLVGVTVSNFPTAGYRVVPGDVGHSFLWRKLTDDLGGGSLGAPMPNVVPWVSLPADQLEQIRCWIASGAN